MQNNTVTNEQDDVLLDKPTVDIIRDALEKLNATVASLQLVPQVESHVRGDIAVEQLYQAIKLSGRPLGKADLHLDFTERP